VAKKVHLVQLSSFELSKLVKILNWWSKFKMVKNLVWQLWPSTNQTHSVVQLAVVMGFLHSNGRFVADVSNPTYQG
jgi:hypothetical protein